MIVAINSLPLVSGHRARGTGTYTKYLIEALERHETKHTYVFFTDVRAIPKDTDLVHYPFFDPFFLTLPFFKPFPTVVTVHDLIPLVFPDKFPPGIRGAIKWRVQKASLRGARRILTDSDCSKADIAKITGRSRAEIDSIPLAPSPNLIPATRDEIDSFRKRYSLPDAYILYVGDVNWNKNIPGLLQIWRAYLDKREKNHPVSLVLTGSAFTQPDLPETREIIRMIGHLGIDTSVIRPGFIKEPDMPALYSGALATVLPSWYEGFGLPVLESFACGTPVVAAKTGSIPEISGPARLYDPEDFGGMATAVHETISLREQDRSKLTSECIAWAKTFTWQRVAMKTVAAYEKAIHHHTNV